MIEATNFLGNNPIAQNNPCQAIEIYASQYDNRGLWVGRKTEEKG
jgi:hypothetical protein